MFNQSLNKGEALNRMVQGEALNRMVRGEVSAMTILLVVVAVIALLAGYFWGLSEGKKEAETKFRSKK